MAPDEHEKAQAERRKRYLESDFDPGYRQGSIPAADFRVANAAEYAAYQLGQINRNLAKLVAHFEKAK